MACAALVATASVRADSMLAQAAPPASSGRGTVLKDRVNIRSRADKNSEIVAQVNKNDSLEVLDHKGTWLHIALPSSGKCYVSTRFIKEGASTADAVNVRCGPNANHDVVGKLAKGEKVEVVKAEGAWTQIKPTAHCTGWIAAEFVEVATPVPTPTASTPEVVSSPMTLPVAPLPASSGIKPAETEAEVHVQYVVKDGILEAVKDETNPPALYELRTPEVEGRSYRIAYLETTEKNLARYEGKHVRLFGNQRWRKTERYPVIAAERIDMVW
jgi:SH3-like domain-containing protein